MTPAYSIKYLGANLYITNLPVDENSYLEGESISISEIVPDNPVGLTFTGWNTEMDGSGTHLSAMQETLMGDADLILYAQWSTNQGFVTIWETDDQRIRLPFIEEGEPMSVKINWGDGTAEFITSDSMEFSVSHDYAYRRHLRLFLLLGKIIGWANGFCI